MIEDTRTLERKSRGKVEGYKTDLQTVTKHGLYTTGTKTEIVKTHNR